jgi:hypothetical protein
MGDDARGVQDGAGAPASAPTVTWAEQEIVTALRRLAAAQAQLATAEAEYEEAQVEVARRTDREDLTRLEEIHRELMEARARASGWFGRSARDRVPALEMAEEVVLHRLGAATYLEARARAAEASVAEADTHTLEFARRELHAAQAEWREVQALELRPAAPAIDLTEPAAPPPVAPVAEPVDDAYVANQP